MLSLPPTVRVFVAVVPSEPLAAAATYYKNHREALFRFIGDPLVPIDNSHRARLPECRQAPTQTLAGAPSAPVTE